MDDVLAWVAAPDTAKATVLGYLRRSPAPAYVADVSQFLSTNDKTRSSITSTIMPALSWLTVDTAVAAASGRRLRRRPAARLSAEPSSCSAPRTARPRRWSPR